MVNLTDEFNKNIPDSLGTAGQVLTVNSGATAGEWADAAGGSWNLLSTVSASSSSTVEFTSAMTGYNHYAVIISGAVPSTGSVRLNMRLKRSGDSGFFTGGDYVYTTTTSDTYNGNAVNSGSTGSSYIDLTGFQIIGNYSGNPGNSGVLYFPDFNSSTKNKLTYGKNTWHDSSLRPMQSIFTGTLLYNTAIVGVQFYFSSGNIDVGKFSLYGLSV